MNKYYCYFHFSFDKTQFIPWFLCVGSRHCKEIFINIFCVELNISIYAKDWMVKSPELLYGKYEHWVRNPKYKDEELNSFMFPSDKKQDKR